MHTEKTIPNTCMDNTQVIKYLSSDDHGSANVVFHGTM